LRLLIFRLLIVAALFLAASADKTSAAELLKKIRIASKAPGESLVPYMVAQRLGFYRDAGLDVDVIVTRGTVTTQVVLSGAGGYGTGGGRPGRRAPARRQ